MQYRLAAAAVLVWLLTGCVSKQIVQATGITDKTVCIVDNPSVRPEFRDAYERQIRAKGYETKIVADVASCLTTTTYRATYGFHWGAYLSSAQLTVFSSGKEIGKAIYKAPYADPSKHGRVEGKIETLVSQLLP